MAAGALVGGVALLQIAAMGVLFAGSMRRPAVIVALVVIVAGLAVAAPGYLTRGRDYVAVTPQAPCPPPASCWVRTIRPA